MRKSTIILFTCVFLLWAANAFAYTWSKYDPTDPISNGTWAEAFGTGGEGSAGSELLAGSVISSSFGTEWVFYGATLVGTPTGVQIPGGMQYTTNYQNGVLELLAGGPWGSAITINATTIKNTTDKLTAYPDFIRYTIQGWGTDSGSTPYYFTAFYEGTEYNTNNGDGTIPALYQYKSADLSDKTGHWRKDPYTFCNLEITIVPIPAAAWLFASGLIGLVVIRRKKG